MYPRVRVNNRRRYEDIMQFRLEDIVLVLDVDGVLTDGTFTINHYGKKSTKTFGPDDNDALKELAALGVRIYATSADTLGQAITVARLAHMGIPFFESSSSRRVYAIDAMLQAGGDLRNVIYMGDGYHDWRIFEKVGLGVAPGGSFSKTEEAADIQVVERGGQRAVAEFVRFLIEENV